MGLLATPVGAGGTGDTSAAKSEAADKAPAPASQSSATAQPGTATDKKPAEKASTLTNDKDKLSYSFGQNIGKSFKQQEIEINLEIFVKGVQDALAGSEPLLNQQEMGQVLMAFQKDRMAKMTAKHKTEADKNLKEGETFLAENKKKEGVTTLPSGLQYKVVKSGTGKTPKATDKVTTHYRGTLIDGTVFDSSYDRKEPTSFPVNGVIKGWTEALQLMKEGDKWQLFVPAQLGYGERGAGGKIGANATLIFDIELLKVEPAEAAEKEKTPSLKLEIPEKGKEGESKKEEKSPK
jgi:FKBP-type peptidyl-prolyl cis-trans isomerase